ncbi:hypothetical protein [Streptosporangium canum]|uniref:hypothetical protein n=1 Tax=Streptosporangium canum TaxID=324952 RepID=UPI00342A5C2E
MTPRLSDHSPVTCLNVTGCGEPGGAEHVSAIQALHAVAAAMNVQVGPLEGRWWVEDEQPWTEVPRDRWRWHLLLSLPGAPEPGAADTARETARASGAAVDRVQVVTFTEGQCVGTAARRPLQRGARVAAGDGRFHGRPRPCPQWSASRGVPVGL